MPRRTPLHSHECSQRFVSWRQYQLNDNVTSRSCWSLPAYQTCKWWAKHTARHNMKYVHTCVLFVVRSFVHMYVFQNLLNKMHGAPRTPKLWSGLTVTLQPMPPPSSCVRHVDRSAMVNLFGFHVLLGPAGALDTSFKASGNKHLSDPYRVQRNFWHVLSHSTIKCHWRPTLTPHRLSAAFSMNAQASLQQSIPENIVQHSQRVETNLRVTSSFPSNSANRWSKTKAHCLVISIRQTNKHTLRNTLVCKYIHTRTHTYIQIRVHTCAPTYVHKQKHVHTYSTYSQTNKHMDMHTYVHTVYTDIRKQCKGSYIHTYLCKPSCESMVAEVGSWKPDLCERPSKYIAERSKKCCTKIHTYIQECTCTV